MILISLVVVFLFGSRLVWSEEPHNYKYDSAAMKAQLEKGKSELESIEKFAYRARLPQNGECWKAALDNLRVSCSQLTEEIQSRLAISFTSCFSDMVGLPNYICSPTDTVKSCIQSMDEQGVHSFRQFFLHTMDMCHYIQSELWQLETDRAVNTLQLAAIEMGKTVNEQKKTADSILSAQQEAQKVQEDMLKENNVIFETVTKIKDVFEDFSQSASEHRAIFLEIFQKLSRMQELVTWIQGEMSLIDFIGFYLMAILFSYFATATERTQKARVWIVFSLALCIAAERYTFNWMSDPTRNYTPEDIYAKLWLLRRGVAAISVILLIYAAAKYRDYDALNNSILYELQNSMERVLEYHRREGAAALNHSLPLEEPYANKPSDWLPPNLVEDLSKDLDLDLEDEADLSTETDITYSGSDDEDYVTPQISQRSQTNTSSLSNGFVSRISDLLSDSLRSVVKISPVPFATLPTADSGSDEEFLGDDEVKITEIVSPGGTQHSYNLRARKPTTPRNPHIEYESPTQFFRSIAASRRSRSRKINKSRNSTGAFFSADEEDGI